MFTQFLDKYLVDNWRKAPKFLSLWSFAIIGLAPELFDLAVQYKLLEADQLPAIFARAINLFAFLGAAGRMIDQAAVAKSLKRKPDDTTT